MCVCAGTLVVVVPLSGPQCQFSWFLERKTQRRGEREECVTQRTLEISASSFQRAKLSASRLALALVSSITPFISWAGAFLFTILPPKPPVILSTPKVHQKRFRYSLTGFHRFQSSLLTCCFWFKPISAF